MAQGVAEEPEVQPEDFSDPKQLIASIRGQYIGESRIGHRKAAEDNARHFLDEHAGRMSLEQAFELGRAFNTDFRKGKELYDRFKPAFHGALMQRLVDDLENFNEVTGRLWSRDEAAALEAMNEVLLDKNVLLGAGRSYPSVVMYLRDPSKFAVWMRATTRGLRALTGYVSPTRTAGVAGYLEFCEQVRTFADQFDLEPQELDVLFTHAGKRWIQEGKSKEKAPISLSDSFQFLTDLRANNTSQWMEENRGRYRKELDVPFRRLLESVASKYMVSLDPQLITEVKTGKVLASIRKRFPKENDEYYDYYWGAFSRKRKQEDVQLYVNLHWDRLRFGLYLGSADSQARQALKSAITDHGDALWQRLSPLLDNLDNDELLFEADETARKALAVSSVADLAAWVNGNAPAITQELFPGNPLLSSGEIVDQVGRLLSSLHPLAAVAWGEDVTEWLEGEGAEPDEAYEIDQLAADVYMSVDEIQEWVDLLNEPSKRQALLYGPPGTGKTFVAQNLARHLAGPEGEALTVQFHPSFSYEDFLEGLRPVLKEGDVRYEVRPGLFYEFCERARGKSGTFVLLIDEINRAELGAVLGELMMLLEYREMTLQLPYSQKKFSVPKNVVVLATMNTADRSLALVDYALRRRFHAIPMSPNRDVLAGHLEAEGQEGSLALEFFDLVQKHVADSRVSPGHSYWMAEDLSPESLDRIWRYELRPYLEEYWFEHPARLKSLDDEIATLLAEEA